MEAGEYGPRGLLVERIVNKEDPEDVTIQLQSMEVRLVLDMTKIALHAMVETVQKVRTIFRRIRNFAGSFSSCL